MIFQSSVEWHRWQVKSTELASSSAEMSGPRGDPGGVSYRVRDICSSLCLLTGSVILQMPAFLFPSWFPNPGFFHFLSHLLLCLRNTGLRGGVCTAHRCGEQPVHLQSLEAMPGWLRGLLGQRGQVLGKRTEGTVVRAGKMKPGSEWGLCLRKG